MATAVSFTAVITTKGERHHYLEPMASVIGPRNTIIVHTDPGSKHIRGARNVDDYGPVNIQRWWNTGIALSEDNYVAVLNDDLTITHETLPALAHMLDRTGATLAHHDPEGAHHYQGLDRVPPPGQVVRITGWCWMLNRAHGILPDTRYRWWFGDNDLALRALRDGHGIATTAHGTPVHHHPNNYTSRSPELQALADADRATYEQTHRGVEQPTPS